jgi:hypothetical protein
LSFPLLLLSPFRQETPRLKTRRARGRTTSLDGIVNLFALMQSSGKGREGLTFSVSQAAMAGTVISRQIWNRCLIECIKKSGSCGRISVLHVEIGIPALADGSSLIVERLDPGLQEQVGPALGPLH